MNNNTSSKKKQSLYFTLGLVIVITISTIMAAHTAYKYFMTKNKIIQEMKKDSRDTIVALEKNIEHLMEAYAVHEYEKLITHELERRGIYAIIVEDYNMGKMTGTENYVTGRVKNDQNGIVNYDPKSEAVKKKLQNSYYHDRYTITGEKGVSIGKLHIYISDENMQMVLERIIYDMFIDALLITVLLIAVLFIALRAFIFIPLAQITHTLEQKDSDGIPMKTLKQSSFEEVSGLIETINNMIHSVKRSRTQLKDLNERLLLAWDGVNDGLWDWNILSSEVYYSKKWKEMLGYCEYEIQNSIKTFLDLLHENDKQRVQNTLEKHFENPEKNLYAIEIQMRCKNGEYKWVLARGKATLNKEGKAVRMLGSLTDIDETKKIHERINKAEIKFHTLFEESMDAIVLLNLETQKFVEYNSKALELYEYSNEEFKSITTFDLSIEFNETQMYEKQNEILKNGLGAFVTKHKTKSGKILDIAVKSKPVDINGKDGLYIVLHDITKEKENELKLARSLELQTRIFDNVGYILIRTNKSGIIKQVNKEAEKVLGYKAHELVDKYTPEMLHEQTEVKERSKLFSKSLKKEVKEGFDTFVAKCNEDIENEHEWTYISKDKEKIPVLLKVSALKDSKGDIYGYLGIAQDITQRKMLESQSKMASMGEMIGNIAHQWRQPLSVISTIASGIKVKSEFGQFKPEEMLSDMSYIVQQTQYLSKTIDDFRNFINNTDAKNIFSLIDCLNKTTSILHSSMVNHKITLIENYNGDIRIDGFQNQLTQAFINIMNNAKDAIKATVPNHEHRWIFLQTKETHDGLVLTIKDSGGGIKESVMGKIFEPYFTTKHQSTGTGIGLSMAHQILTQHHNATIQVFNENYTYEGKNYRGAVFQITFKK